MAKFALLTPYTCEELKEYDSVEEVLKDVQYKVKESFWIGDKETNIALDITQFMEQYTK